MTNSTDRGGNEGDWDSIGRAAEDFARRVARDAGKFAERMEEHAGEFARDVSRDWRRARRSYRHACRRGAGAPEVRRVFEDIRTVVADVLDGVDELIERVFNEPAPAPDDEWVRLVVNRDAVCAACARLIPAGDEAHARRTATGREFRCVTCGVPPPSASAG
jgi:hypothetical protein